MEKMKMETANIADETLLKLKELLPDVFSEGVIAHDEDGNPVSGQVIDKDKLTQLVNCHVVEGREERYQFTWPEKKKSVLLANAPSTNTLRPCREESEDFDNTENLYIEGDNLEVLKLLRETYLHKVKMIYIDPPYNTGSDFVYEDDFSESIEEYKQKSGDYDTDGNRLVKNQDSNGRFHTDWLNMIYPRLKLAKDMLTEDGVIFISIDDNEVGNLRKICDEIFGSSNFEGHIHWRRRHNQPNDKTKMIGLVAEHILCFAKNSNYLRSVGVGKIDITGNFSNPDNDVRGPWASKPWKVGSDQSGSKYKIVSPTGLVFEEEWMGEEATFLQLKEDGRIIFPKDGDGFPRKKYYQSERAEEGQCATNWWSHQQFGHNQGANDCLTDLMGRKNVFTNPKPIELIRGLLQIANVKDQDIVLDFFSGSASTAHAIMKMNSEEMTHRRFILVQLDENLDETIKSATGKTKAQIQNAMEFLDSIGKPHFIPEIAKERIRRVGRNIKNELPLVAQNIDVGFRVLKLDSSNMENVYYIPDELQQGQIPNLVDNVKKGRSDEDLLFQVMLGLGISLSSKIEIEPIDGFDVYEVEGSFLIACFNKNITDAVVTAIAKKHPHYVILRDMANDDVLTNFEEIFKAHGINLDNTKVL